MLWVIYAPLLLAAAAVAVLLAARLSRRGWGRIPRPADRLHREVGRALPAAAVIDDAGLSWRLLSPDGVRITLPYHWSSYPAEAWSTPAAAEDRAPGREETEETEATDEAAEAWTESGAGAAAGADFKTPALGGGEPTAAAERVRHFAFVIRGPLPRLRSRGGSRPVGFGLPLELVSYYSTTENGMPAPAGPTPGWQAAPGREAGGKFELREASVPRIVRRWGQFDRDLTRLLTATTAGLQADWGRAFVLGAEGVVWLEEPLWPKASAPPAPFLIHLIEDEVQVLCLYPGHTPEEAFAEPAWMAAQMRWFAEALPALTAGALKAQKRVSRAAAEA